MRGQRLTDAERVFRKQTEDALMRDLVGQAKVWRWWVQHTRSLVVMTATGPRGMAPIQGQRGFPDLLLVRDAVLAWELKREVGNDLDEDQRAWGTAFAALIDVLGSTCPVEYRVVRPSDYESCVERLRRPPLPGWVPAPFPLHRPRVRPRRW